MSLFAAPGPDGPQCSRAGCQAEGGWEVRWRNPKLHAGDRVKVWLACAEHRDYLSEFVAARGFLLETVPREQA